MTGVMRSAGRSLLRLAGAGTLCLAGAAAFISMAADGSCERVDRMGAERAEACMARFRAEAERPPGRAEAEAREVAWVEMAQASVRARLRDPASAQFSGTFVSRSSGAPVACGSVNARNGFGGYAGPVRFVSGGTADLTLTEHDVADFGLAWARLCGR